MFRKIHSAVAIVGLMAALLSGHARAQGPHMPIVNNPIIFVCFNDPFSFPVCFNNSVGFGFLAFQSSFAANTNFGAGQILFDPIIGGFLGGLSGATILGGPLPFRTPIPEMDAAVWFVDPLSPVGFDFAFWPIVGQDTATGNRSLTVGVAVMINVDNLFSFASSGPFQANMSAQITSPDQTVTASSGMMYHDAQGRSRVELQVPINDSGGTATMAFINDPVAQTAYVLNYNDSTAYQVQVGQVKSNAMAQFQGYTAAQQAAAEAGAPAQNWSSLGSQVIQGNPANGSQITRSVATSSSSRGRMKMNVTTQVWLHPTLNTPLQTSVTDDMGFVRSLNLSNLLTGVAPSPGLFQIPSGFTLTGVYPPQAPPPPPPPPPDPGPDPGKCTDLSCQPIPTN